MLNGIRSSLRHRIIAAMVILLVLVVATVAIAVWWGQQQAASGIAQHLSTTATKLEADQNQSAAQLREQMLTSTQQALRSKLSSLAKLLAGLSVTPILTEDFGVLETYCQQIDQDGEVVWVTVAKEGDKLLAQSLDDNGKKALTRAGCPENAPFAQLNASLGATKGLVVIRTDILIDGKKKGVVTVVGSEDSLAEQKQVIEGKFNDIATANRQAFSTMQTDLSGDIASANHESLLTILIVAVIGVVIGAVIATSLARSITIPIREVGVVISNLAKGDLNKRAIVSSRDEVGTMAQALNSTMDGLKESVRTIAGDANGLAGAAEELSAVSRQLSDGASQASLQAQSASAGSQQVSQHVATIAAGIEELGSSVGEIAQNAVQAAQVAQEAVQLTDSANTTMTKLGTSSSEIRSIVKLISSIAEQTNLLALNATIEAARAGDAGRGFAVVASEVKELARQTSAATEEIGGKTAAIEHDSQAAMEVIGKIATIVNRINDLQQSIAGAVEEQAATTKELTGNVAEAAKGSSEIAESITRVATTVQQTTAGAEETLKSAHELARLAGELKQVVAHFHC